MRISYTGTRFFNKLFNLRTTEWPRLLLIYLMYFVLLVGGYWGEPIVQAAFLEQVGGEFIPWLFVVNAIFSIIAIAIYTPFADRVDNTRLLIALFVISAGGIAIGLMLLGWGLVAITYPLLYLILNVPLLSIFNVHWSTYVNSFYDTQSAKRIFPLLGSGIRLAGITAGFTLPLLNRFFSPSSIIIIWLITLLIAALIAWLMPYVLKKDKVSGGQSVPAAGSGIAGTTGPTASYIDSVREGFRYVTQSSFLRWLALSALLIFMLFQFIDYQVLRTMEDKLKTTEDISNFLAWLNGISNLIALPIQLLLLNRLISRVGLGNTSLIFPTGTLGICGALISSWSIPTAALGYINKTTFRTTFRNPIDNLLYNAVPLRVKGRARAFIVGMVVPIGSLIGGLLLFVPIVHVAWIFAAIVGVLAVAYLASALIVRKQYAQALVTMLEQEDFSFLFSQGASALVATDPATLNLLQKKLEESSSPEFTIFMAQLISQIGGKEAVSILGQAARAAKEGRERAAIIDVLVAADMRDQAVYQLYTDFLTDTDSHIRQSVMTGLEQLAGPGDERFLNLALGMLTDPDIDVRIQTLSALARSGNFYNLPQAVEGLNQLLAGNNPHRRARGVRILGRVSNTHALRTIHSLIQHLTESEDEVRLEAAVAIETLSKKKLPAQAAKLILEQMHPLLQDPVERVRQAALNVLGRLGDYETYKVIVEALTDPSPQVRATAIEVLVQVGKPVISIVHPQLDSPDLQRRKMAAVVLSRINRREFGTLINAHITNNLLAIYSHHGRIDALQSYARYPGISVLQSALREQNQQLLDEIFYILAAVHDSDDLNIITESFKSDSARTRANATEALESLTTPQTAQLIAPLFEPDPKLSELLDLSRETWGMQHPDTIQTIEQLISDPDAPWLRAIVTFALGEMVVSLKTPGQPTPSSQPPLTLSEIEAMLENSAADPSDDVRLAVQAVRRMLAGFPIIEAAKQEETVFSTIERIIFLKGVPFFQGMTVNQLEVLAKICEEELFEEDKWIFHQGDPGGALYVIVSGRVGIEQEKRQGSYARLATLGAHSYFGEMSLFDNNPRSAGAITLQDTLTLSLRREPLIALARQYPDLSLELINVLSERLREANDRIADLTRSRPRKLQKLYDQLD